MGVRYCGASNYKCPYTVTWFVQPHDNDFPRHRVFHTLNRIQVVLVNKNIVNLFAVRAYVDATVRTTEKRLGVLRDGIGFFLFAVLPDCGYQYGGWEREPEFHHVRGANRGWPLWHAFDRSHWGLYLATFGAF